MWSYFFVLGKRESDSCCSLSCKDSVLEKYVTVTKLRDITHWFKDMRNPDMNFRYGWIQQLTLCCQDSNSSHFLDVVLYVLASLSDHLSPQDCKSFWSLWAICFHSTNSSPMKIGFMFPKTPLKVLELISLALLAGLQIHVHHHGWDGTTLWLPRTASHATSETRSDSAPPNHTNKDWGSVTLHGKSGRWSPQEGETNLAN